MLSLFGEKICAAGVFLFSLCYFEMVRVRVIFLERKTVFIRKEEGRCQKVEVDKRSKEISITLSKTLSASSSASL